MATRIKARKEHRKIYPWDKWSNGDIWRARLGRDFKCPIYSFKAMLYSAAKRRGMDVSLSTNEDVVEFQFRRSNGNK